MPAGSPSITHALAPAQRRFWLGHRAFPEAGLGNELVLLELEGTLDVAALEAALAALHERHPALRSTYHETSADEVEVRVHPPQVQLTRTAAEGWSLEQVFAAAEERARARWDYAAHPTVRWELFTQGPERAALVCYLPHLSMDGYTSYRLIPEELLALYLERVADGPALEPLETDYAAFACAQREAVEGAEHAEHVAWWRERLAGCPAALELPTDRRRPPVVSTAAARARRWIPVDPLRASAKQLDASLNDLCFAAWTVLLHRLTRAEDLVVGVPIASRAGPFAGVAGCLMNVLAVRADLSGQPTFSELLARQQEAKRAAYPHRHATIDAVLNAVRPTADPSRNPLYQVMFNFMNFTRRRLEGGGLRLTLHRPDVPASLDLTLHLEEQPDELLLELEYSTALFLPESAERLVGLLARLLEEVVADPARPIDRLSLLTAEERRWLLEELNDTAGPYPDDLLLHQPFEAQAARAPSHVALRSADATLSYAELNARANRLAHHLRAQGVEADQLVGICFERGFDLVVAMLGVLKAGGAYVPLDPAHPLERIAFTLEDTAASLVVTQASLVERLPAGQGVVVLDGDAAAAVAACSPEDPAPVATPDQRAYVIFTSGSTGRPKGVVVRHQPALNLTDWVNQTFDVGPDDRLLFVTSPCFDLSVYDVFGVLGAGGEVRVASSAELRDPDALVELLVSGGITFWDSAPAALGQLVPFLPQQPATRSRLRLVFLSGDWIPVPLPDQLRAVFPEARVISLGGATEATVWSNVYPIEQVDPDWKSIPYGRPIRNARYYALDRHLEPTPVGVPGELFIGGPCLASGYHARPELTAERFLDDPFGDEPGGKLYRTGDMARVLADGNLEFLGRVDLQVKVRGYRIELEEIESVLDQHPGVQRSVVAAPPDEAGERVLVAYAVPRDGELSAEALRGYLTAKLPSFMVPAHVVLLDEVPLTANGKVDRRALPPPPREARAYVAPRTATEAAVAEVWADVLSLERVGVHDSFFALGGSSVRAARALSAIRARFSAPLSLAEFYEHPSVAGMAAFLARREERTSIPRAARPRPRWPLAGPQLRIWFAQQQRPEWPGLYNVPLVLTIGGPLDRAAFQRAWEALVARHEALRTTIDVSGEVPLQRIHPPGPVDLPLLDLREHDLAKREQLLAVRCALEQERALDLSSYNHRITLIALERERHVLLLNQHHMLTDEWSLVSLIAELAAAYEATLRGEAPELPELTIDYPDYALWETQEPPSSSERAFWTAELEELRVIELPRPADPAAAPTQGTLSWTVPDATAARIEALCREVEATPFAGFLGLFAGALARTFGSERLGVGVLAATRERPELEPVQGCLVNMLLAGLDLRGRPSFRTLTARVRDKTNEVLRWRETPLERVTQLARELGLDTAGLQQIVFSYLESSGRVELEGDLDWSWEVLEPHGAKFDLGVEMLRREAGLRILIRYRPQRVDAVAVERLGSALLTLIDAAAADPEARFAAVSLLEPAERRRLLSLSYTPVDYPHELGFAQRFEAQARATPERPALRDSGGEWTYAQLDRRSNRLARALREAGVERGTRVGVLLPRSPDYVAAILAILKAGGVFVPLEIDGPAQRRAWTVEDAGLELGISRAALTGLEGAPPRCLAVEAFGWGEGPDAAPLEPTTTADDPGYVTYTSGSTGRPKGVLSLQRGVLRLLSGPTYKQLDPPSTWFLIAPLTFDTSVQQIFAPLLSGGAVVALEQPPSMESIAEARRLGADTLDLSSGLFHTLVDERLDLLEGLRQVFVGGDVVSPAHARRAAEALPDVRFYDQYGPTECGIWATAHRMGFDEGAVPIGKPLPNTHAYVLDAYLEPVPEGVPGELYLGGEGVALGYLDRPELTAEKFLEDPFSEVEGARMYATGDLVRWRHDGVLEFLGRADRQVKIRGFRVEPGEVEGALGELPGVLQAAVAVREGPGGRYLAGYVTPDGLDTDALRARLETALPAHLVPDQLVCLAELPLTSRGKLDRDRLPDPLADALDASAPRDDVERRVKAIWDELLQADVGIHADFFLQGGNSLLALRLASRVERELQQPMPLAALLDHPTIATLSEHLRQGGGRAGSRQVVCMQPGRDTRSPLWLIHPIGGHALYARWLADRQDPDLPVYGIEARGLDGQEEPSSCLIEMARDYVAQVREVQPEGPYYIGGYSFGGTVAFEMARQLQALGQEVAPLLLIDSLAQGGVRKLRPAQRALSLARYALALSPQERRAYLQERVGRRLELLLGLRAEDWTQEFPEYELAADPNIDPERRAAVQRVIQASLAAGRGYTFEPYDGAAYVFVATQRIEMPGREFDEANGWRQWVRGGVTVVPIDCRHTDMLDEPARTDLGNRIRRLLAELHRRA